MSQETKDIVRRYVDEVYNRGNLEHLEQLVTEDYVNHLELLEVQSVEGLRQFAAGMHEALPDMLEVIHDQVADGDLEVHRYTITGTHQGEWLGIPGTGNPLILDGLTMTRVRDGKVAEEWTFSKTVSLLVQMGAIDPEMLPG